MEDSSKFDLEMSLLRHRDIGVNTSPLKDEVNELWVIIERQERVLRNNNLAKNHLGELIKHQQPMQNDRFMMVLAKGRDQTYFSEGSLHPHQR